MTKGTAGRRQWRLIALDMDGTILSEGLTISPGNLAWLRRAQAAGMMVTFATGRLFPGFVQRYARELELTAPVITLNGGTIWTVQGELLEARAFTSEQLVSLRGIAATAQADYLAYTAECAWNPSDFAVKDGPWIKCVFGCETQDGIARLRERLEQTRLFEVTNTHPLNIEVNPRDVSKAQALQTVCRRLDIDAAQVVAMGDSLNDVAMLRFAGFGVAMDNATPAVKAVADMVTLHHEQDGVAHAIRFLLEGRGQEDV